MIAIWYRRILAVAAVGIFFTNVAQFMFATETLRVAPLYWVAGFGLAAAPLALTRDGLVAVVRSPVVYWCIAFLAITGVWLIFQSTATDGAWKELNARILTAVSLVSMVSVFSTADAIRWARWSVFGAVAMAIVLNLYELFNPMTFSEVMGRSAGLYVNPNQSAAAIILGFVLTLTLIKEKYRLVYAIGAGVGVFVTFSRSAAVAWVLVVGFAMVLKIVPLRRSALIGGLAILIVGGALALEWDAFTGALDDAGVLNKNVLARVAAHSNDIVSDDSSAIRMEVAERAWKMFANSPLVGNGVAASLDWDMEVSSHNQYLNMMVDHGAIGILLLPAIVLAALWGARGGIKGAALLFALFVLYAGFFSHNVLSERYYLVAFALLGAMAAASRAAVPQAEAV